MELTLDLIKAVCVVLSLGVAVVGLALPSYGGLRPATSLVLNLGAGGVILSAALCHLLPDAAATDGAFPWSFALCGAGYLATLTLDAVVGGHGDDGYAPVSRKDGVDDDPDDGGALEAAPTPAPAPAAAAAVAATAGATTAMTVHALGDGAAIGVQRDARAAAVVGAAIVIHKFFGALALGAILSRRGRLEAAPAALFALATPAALVAAWAGAREDVFEEAGAARVTALCAGSLLHVCVHEILDHNVRRPEFRAPAKLACIWAGFAAMTLLARWS